MLDLRLSHRRIWCAAIVLAVVALPAALAYRTWSYGRLTRQLLDAAHAALDDQQFADAERYARVVLAREPDRSEAALIAGEAAVGTGHIDVALQYLEPLTTGSDSRAVLAQCAVADVELQRGQAARAETLFRRALELDPQQPFAKRQLVFLLNLSGRRWEAWPLQLDLLRQDRFTPDDLLALGRPEAVLSASELKRLRKADPDNALLLLGEVRQLMRKLQFDEAEKLLREIIARQPDQLDAQATLGSLLMERPANDPVREWHRELPAEADAHPGVWVVRGLWAQRQHQTQAAARAFWEALRRDPNQRVATYQLSICLAALGQSTAAAALRQRYELLSQLGTTLDALYDDRDNVQLVRKSAETCEALGRLWEAYGWRRLLVVMNPSDAADLQARDRLAAALTPETPPVLPAKNPVSTLDLSSFPRPSFQASAPAVVGHGEAWGPVRFADVAASAGIDFQYFNGDDPHTEGRRMFEFTGGGVAVIDYDADGWPDLYWTQGCVWPPDPNQKQYRDRLYRNLGNGRMADVTEQAGLGDQRFSQGVTVGDFDDDGFPDIYLANVGVNRLYHNNGDGTFTDVAEAAGVGGERWTTSCLIADLNGDSLPDLYEVNYVQGKDVYDLICSRDGRYRTCSPREFDAQQDRLFVNLGDGRFVDRSAAAGIVVPNGKGLGIVAADTDGQGRLNLFVANDTEGNFFFVNQTQRPGEPLFEDRGRLAGLAFDRDGRPQASMGVAADDLDGDGLVDFFVTNFYVEANTLYQQQEGGFFTDVSRERGLADSSLFLLGFGTQALDGELDGEPDLVITNGHIDDFTYSGTPFQMPPQYYRNVGAGYFQELPGADIGPYFQRKLLGRGLARLDWNGDGREDFAVSHLDAPVALLENRTTPCGHFLAVELRGTQSARDAIGARVMLQAGGHRWSKQLTAGDGYMASNQRLLTFGLGAVTQVDRLEIVWPSGQHQQWEHLPVGCRMLFREGEASPYVRQPFQADW